MLTRTNVAPPVAQPRPRWEPGTPRPLTPGSTAAQALYHAWSGERIVVIDSPPGAGKSELIVSLAAHLSVNAGLRVCIATPTRAQALALTERCLSQMAAKTVTLSMSGLRPDQRPPGVGSGDDTERKVSIRTIANLAFSTPADSFDVLLVDEAYQATFASVSVAWNAAPQIVLVGDPGQIGPVVTVDTSLWANNKLQPQAPAPDAFVRMDGAVHLSLGQTWRLGQPSVDVLAPLYDFPFTSARRPTTLHLEGERQPEIAHVSSQPAPDHDDPALMRTVADRAVGLLGGDLSSEVVDEDGNTTVVSWKAAPGDLAVVLSRNSQCAAVNGMLGERLGSGHGVVVGTADRLQGGQWPIVVAADPLAGGVDARGHSTSLGRLAVMLSRHTHHLSWVHDGQWESYLVGRATSVQRARTVRRLLTGFPAA